MKTRSLIVVIMFVNSVEPLRPLYGSETGGNNEAFTRILSKLLSTDSRRLNAEELLKAKTMFNYLLRNLENQDDLATTEQSIDVPVDNLNPINIEQAEIVETELASVLRQQSSALLDKAYIEQKGKNDFLVLKPELRDPFATVVPNSIYYNIEKKCVNWLDDCSLQGIRARLLQNERTPLRK